MAASGIAEHLEARRREDQMNRRAYYLKLKPSGSRGDVVTHYADMIEGDPNPSSYEREIAISVGHTCNRPTAVDRQRRAALNKQQEVDYTARLPNRYNSINYQQQW